MRVNGMLTFDQFWLTNYCTDAPCCTKCCDTTPTCLANLSPPQVLDTTDLSQFTAGPNTLSWEVNEEVGGSGFYTEMTVEY